MLNHQNDIYINGRKIDIKNYTDVKLVPFDQEPNSPFFMQFSSDHELIMQIFRGIMNTNEISQRALYLTELLLEENPNDSAIWWYRSKILNKIGFDPLKELELTDNVIKTNLKSYQCWQHRKWVLRNMKKKPNDLNYLRQRLYEDTRNFHAWSYAIWLGEFYRMYDEVLNLTTEFIDLDKTNSSAWNARITLFKESKKDLNEELIFTFTKITVDGGNESCCNHIRAIIAIESELISISIKKTREFLEKFPNDKSMLILLLHLLDKINDYSEHEKICSHLIKIDSLRKRYWKLVMKKDSKYV